MKLSLDGTVDPWWRFAAFVAKSPKPIFGPDFSKLQVELILQIIENLDVSDLSRLCCTCRKLNQIIHVYRPLFDRIDVNSINIQYGKWYDVLTKARADKVKVNYYMPDHKTLPKIRKSRFLKAHRVVPLKGVLLHTHIKNTFIHFELIHPEMAYDLHLSNLSTNNLFLNFSHHSIQQSLLKRYWPSVADAINGNLSIDSVNVILSPKTFEFYEEIVKSLPDCSVEAVVSYGFEHCKIRF
ncbi:unnamed protein product [Bursaphelenchus okinawaensis]|uniref:F-box domain-containing protein n=1 Tax=Bursaphelenchus okinawaensis TaxID=465554 RepID=A0A811KYF5_9BILA|nr:unnamed protein product [Bursaphelenchus okinawaensis]CAG9114567.1 unnamed protein product [Bursaphelenchus okinawaensis]